MIAEQLLLGLSVLSVSTVARPGYSSLSEAIMSSMTNLWNEKQSSLSSATSEEDNHGWLDLYEDNDSKSTSNDEPFMQLYSQNTPSPVNSPMKATSKDQRKSEYVQYPDKIHPLLGRRTIKPLLPPLTTHRSTVKLSKKDPGPLYRALYDSHPLSFEHLLHYYDYLDDSDESCTKDSSSSTSMVSQKKPSFSDAVESMLSKFIGKLTGLIDRPVVVHANVCCSSIPPEVMAVHNATEMPSSVPDYVKKTPPVDRYAANQVDIVQQMKEQYDKVIRLMNIVSQMNETSNLSDEDSLKLDSVPVVPPESIPLENSTSVPSTLPMETNPTSEAITTTLSIDISSPQSIDTSEKVDAPSTLPPSEFETDLPINPKDAVETITEEGNKEPTTESIVELVTVTEQLQFEEKLTEVIPSVEENSVIPSKEHSSSILKRKRRDVRRKKERQPKEETSSAKTEEPTTEAPIGHELDYDDFVKNVLGNKTSLLETMILNRNPIVEHIHAHLLDREIKSGKEWQPPEVKDCEDSTSSSVTSDAIDSEELISNSPDLIEITEVKKSSKVGGTL